MSTSSPNPDSPKPADAGSGNAAPGLCQVVLVKQGQRYVIRYRKGEEKQAIQGLIDMVRDPGNPLDWFDAAVLSHQMGQAMSHELAQRIKP